MAKAPKGMIIRLIREYFKAHPNVELKHDPVVDWVTKQVVDAGYDPPRDPWRTTRGLYDRRILIQVRTGVYKYDPECSADSPDHSAQLERREFPPAVKEEIFKRDKYHCVLCGRGRPDGVEIAADHKIPWWNDGKSTLENGQTLCRQHNSLKKNYSLSEAGKKFFIKIYEQAVKIKDYEMIAFCQSVFDAYDEHYVNGHIPRPDTKKEQQKLLL